MSPAASQRRQVIEALVQRLSDIQLANGFETDAGEAIYTGEAPQLGEGDPDQAIAIVIGEDQPRMAGPGFLVTMPIHIHAVAKASLDDPWTPIEQVLADIKRAVEVAEEDDPGRRLQGLLVGPLERGNTQTLPREAGSLTVGVAITYGVQLKEGWGRP